MSQTGSRSVQPFYTVHAQLTETSTTERASYVENGRIRGRIKTQLSLMLQHWRRVD